MAAEPENALGEPAPSVELRDDGLGRECMVRCGLLHAVRGRVRLHIEPSEMLDELGEAFEAFWREQPGIEAIRLNAECASAVVSYDPDVLTANGVLALTRDVSLERLREYQQRGLNGHNQILDSSAWPYFALSSAAIAIDVFSGASVAPWLLAGAAIPIFTRAFKAIGENGKLNVDVLDASATTVLALQGQIRTAGVMIWLVTLGDFIRDLTLQQSHRAMEGLFEANIQYAWVVRGRKKVRVRVGEVQEGDEVAVYPGELIPVDGAVLTGKATVDQKLLTGESMPVEKGEGDEVYAATVVRDGKLYLRAARVGDKTKVANVMHLLRDAPVRETRAQNYAEQFADRLVPWSLGAAGGHMLATGTVSGAASLLIIDYGSGIRVAAPISVLASMTKAARQGILIKGGRHLEQLASVDTIVFDKTGTLTMGAPEVVELIPYGRKVSATRLLTLAAAAEERLTHPVAEAIVRAARGRGIVVPEREASEYKIGLGVEAAVDGMVVHVGCNRYMTSQGIDVRRARFDLVRISDAAASPIFVAFEGELAGLLVCSDPLRPEAPAVVRALRERGLKEIVMLTGDHPAVAKTAAEALGITRYVADAFPEQKSEVVKALQRDGRKVAVVGDGINDSPALSRADVGIAVRGGADVARETAHVAMLEGNLWKIPQAIDIAREAIGLVRQSWNIIAYPNTAAIALTIAGIIGPVGATLLSNGAGIVAAVNALRPLLGAREDSEQSSNEGLERHLGRGPDNNGAQRFSGDTTPRREWVDMPQVAPLT